MSLGKTLSISVARRNFFRLLVIEIGYCPWCGAKLPPVGEIDLSAMPADDA